MTAVVLLFALFGSPVDRWGVTSDKGKVARPKNEGHFLIFLSDRLIKSC